MAVLKLIKMKKNVVKLMCLLILVMASCTKDDKQEDEISKNLLIGRWFFDMKSVDGFSSSNFTDFSNCPVPKEEYIEFFENGRLVYFEYTGCQDIFNEIQYMYRSDNVLEILDENNTVSIIEVVKVTETILEMEYVTDYNDDGELNVIIETYYRWFV